MQLLLEVFDGDPEVVLAARHGVAQQAEPQGQCRDPKRRAVVELSFDVPAAQPLPPGGGTDARLVVAEHGRRGVERHGLSLIVATRRPQGGDPHDG